MKQLRYLFTFILIGIMVPACVEDEAPEDAFGAGKNLASFTNLSQNLSGVANGNEYEFEIPMEIKGPSMADVAGTVTATVSVDESSTAIEGTHFRIDDPTVEFSSTNDLLSSLKITVLSEGIEAPLAETPVIVLNVSQVSGSDKVIANGKTIAINLLYLCNSQLADTYEVTVEYYRFGTLQSTQTYTETIAMTGEGAYRTQRVGHWTPDQLGGVPGFTFLDVCNEVTIPEQNLVDLYSNIVEGKAGKSSYDPETGVITMEYTICATDCREYKSIYVRQ